MEHASAIHTTTLGDANPRENASRVSTSAAPLALPATPCALARPKPPWGVKTPLRLDRWRYFLDRLDNRQLTEPHLHVLNGIENGFSYRSHKTIEKTCIYSNLRTVLDEPDVIDKAITKELTADRYLGPYTIQEVEGFVGLFSSHTQSSLCAKTSTANPA